MNVAKKILIVDDEADARTYLEVLFRENGYETATAADGDVAMAKVKEFKPDLITLDIIMPHESGQKFYRELVKDPKFSKVPVVILTMSDSRDDLAAALRMGARGYLLKDMDPNDVIEAISRAARGELVVAPAMTAKLAGLLEEGKQRQERETSLDLLTARERQILAYVSRGLSNKAIAKTLGISHDTVKLHVRHILAKLGLVSRVEAAVFAVEHRSALAEAER